MKRLDDIARRWWPLVASLVAGAVLYTLGYVVLSVAEDRDQLRAQNEQLTVQSEQLADIIDRNRRFDTSSETRLARAVDDVEALLVDYFALHDENTARKLNELLFRLAVLLDRPPPEPIQPPPPPRREPPPEQTPPPTTTTRPPSTTTTTSPGRSDLCDRLPLLSPICRSDNP